MILYGFLLVYVVHSLTGVACSPSPGVIYAAAPSERGSYHVGGKGVYNYGYNTGDGTAKVEVRHKDGSVTGSYRYFDPLGRQIVRSYIADKRGFRVLGNELPVAPDTPAIGIPEAQLLTGPVEGAKEFSSPNIIAPKKSLLLQNVIDDTFSPNTIRYGQNEVNQFQNGYVTLTSDFESPYLYSPDNLLYDFPAGFAYPTTPVRLILNPFGVTGEHEKLFLSAGHTPGRKDTASIRPLYLDRKEAVRFRPIYVSSKNRKSFGYRRPYIIGHAK